MRICIDARMMGAGKTRGIGRVIQELVQAMIEIAPQHRYILLEQDPSASPFNHPSVEHVKLNVRWYGLAEQFALPDAIRDARADVYFAPHWNVPFFNVGKDEFVVPRVVFIHDLILREEPMSAHASTRGRIVRWIKYIGFRLTLHRALFDSRAILVPTHHVAERIRHYYPTLKTPVTVAGEGMPDVKLEEWIDAEGSPKSENRKQKIEIQDSNQSLTSHISHLTSSSAYLLYVGSAYPHKNLNTLLDAWKIIEDRHPDLHLQLVGEKDVFMKRTEAYAKSLGLDRVDFIGSVSDLELRERYLHAFAFVFPSRWEGFGLPPLEAIAAGTPVLSSNAACMPEVLGKQGVIYFNPDLEDDIVQAIETLLQDPSSVRVEARKAASELRQRHDWRAAAKRVLAVFEEVISR